MTKKDLVSINVINEHDFYERGRVFIAYFSATSGRMSRSAHWTVFQIGGKANTDAHWRDGGNQTFPVWRPREDKANKLAEAQAWAREHHGITEWAKDPFGSYGEAQYVKDRKAFLKGCLDPALFRYARVRLVSDGRMGHLVFREHPTSPLYRIALDIPEGEFLSEFVKVARNEFEVIG